MNDKCLTITLIIEGQVPFCQKWSVNQTFQGLSDQMVDRYSQGGNIQYQFFSALDKIKKFEPTKTFKEEKLQTNTSIYGLVFQNGIKPKFIEQVRITIILPKSLPLKLDMLTVNSFNDLSNSIVKLRLEFDDKITYAFYSDEKKTKNYSPLKTLKEENIKNNQIIYGVAQKNNVTKNSDFKFEFGKKSIGNGAYNKNKDSISSSRIEFMLEIEGQASFMQRRPHDSTFQELSDSIVDRFGQGDDVTYLFYRYSDKTKKYPPTRTFREENLKKFATIYGVIQKNEIEIEMKFSKIESNMAYSNTPLYRLSSNTAQSEQSDYSNQEQIGRESSNLCTDKNEFQNYYANKSLVEGNIEGNKKKRRSKRFSTKNGAGLRGSGGSPDKRNQNKKTYSLMHIFRMNQNLQQLNDNMRQILLENQGLKKQNEYNHNQIQSQQTHHHNKINLQQTNHHNQLKSIQTDYHNHIRTLHSVHHNQIKTQQANHHHQIKTQQSDHHDQIKSLQNAQDEMKQSLIVTGVYDQVQIQQQWSEYQKEQPDIYKYAKAFYWTLQNCFDAYRIANTGAIQPNTVHINDENSYYLDMTMMVLQGATKVVSSVAPIVSSVAPIVSHSFHHAHNHTGLAVTNLIDKAVEKIYGQIKLKRFDDRIKAINRIICLNNDQAAQFSEHQSRMIQLAALEIAKRKKQIKNGDRIEFQLPTISQMVKEFLDTQMNKIYRAAQLGEKILLFTTMEEREAVKDVTLLLVYLTLQHDTVIEQSKTEKLHIIIADCVMQKKTLEVINTNLMVNEQAQCSRCTLF